MQIQHNPPVSSEAVRARAYELWENQGCPDGRDLDYWLEAERDLSRAASTLVAEVADGEAPAAEKRPRARKAVATPRAAAKPRAVKGRSI